MAPKHRLLGAGGFGLAFRLIENFKDSETEEDKTRQLVMKIARPGSEAELRNEITYLQALSGAEHVVRLLAYRTGDEVLEPPPQRALLLIMAHRERKLEIPERDRLQNSLRGLQGPVAVLEWLENGEIQTLMNRCYKKKKLLPNRILWHFFLCLIRACVALAYPPQAGRDAPNILEEIPEDGRDRALIEHGDLHEANVMIGSTNAFPEHNLVPVVKFIDFGRADWTEEGIPDNGWRAANIMLGLIATRRVAMRHTTYQGYKTQATEILPHGNGDKYPTLDPDLRDFLARCLASNVKDRPDLADMLRTAEDAVRANKYADVETDEAIEAVIQELIYDADMETVDVKKFQQ
ncbi:hypothetical protein Hte_000153 [Hypoxylon texense]